MDVSSIETKVRALTLASENLHSSDAVISFIGSSDCYSSVSQVSPDDSDEVNKLQQARLKFVLQQLKKEREETTFSRGCLFCRHHFVGNRSVLLNHLVEKHNFLIGAPDNIVFADELFDVLEQMLKNLQCFYCEKTFKDWMTLKEHMRKKQHKWINPRNKSFDRFYIINYLEVGKTWTEVQAEDDDFSQGDSDAKEMDLMDCEDENLSYVCLFCDCKLKDFANTFLHMKMDHKFDFKKLVGDCNLNFYQQIKLINYIRRKVFDKECMNCDLSFSFHNELLQHMMDSDHITHLPDSEKWDQTMYYFSTFENDNLLCALDAEDSDFQGENVVYPEDTYVPESMVLCP